MRRRPQESRARTWSEFQHESPSTRTFAAAYFFLRCSTDDALRTVIFFHHLFPKSHLTESTNAFNAHNGASLMDQQ